MAEEKALTLEEELAEHKTVLTFLFTFHHHNRLHYSLFQELDALRLAFAGQEDDEMILYRFGRGYKWDVAAASEALAKTVAWRAEKKVDAAFRARAAAMTQMQMPHAALVSRYIPHR